MSVAFAYEERGELSWIFTCERAPSLALPVDGEGIAFTGGLKGGGLSIGAFAKASPCQGESLQMHLHCDC